MIGFFVDPQPDETLYSIFARYGDRVGYPSQVKLIHELTGSVNPVNLTLLPSRLGHLERALPSRHGLSIDALIDQHTLLPFFGSFWSSKRVLTTREAMRYANKIKTEASAGLHGSHIQLPQWLRYCPKCSEEDRQRIGFRYWHRLHQVPALDICARHGVWLEHTAIPARMLGKWQRLVTAEEGIRLRTRRHKVFRNKSDHQIILKLARDCEWLLRRPCAGINTLELRQQYLSLLHERRLATWNGRLRRNRIVAELDKYYSRELLTHFGCDLGPTDRNNWAIRIFHKSRIAKAHPLQHLLVIHWLGFSVSEFICMKRNSLPFGKGPWPCLNRSADHYKDLRIERCQVSRSARDGAPLGLFSCATCQFTYVRRGPDQGPEDAFRIGKVKSWGSRWDAYLKKIWVDPTIEFKDMQTRLGVCFATIKRQAARLGLGPR